MTATPEFDYRRLKDMQALLETLEFVGQRLKDMQALLLALNDTAVAVSRRLDRIDERFGEQSGELGRLDNSVQTLTLRIAELAVRLGALEG